MKKILSMMILAFLISISACASKGKTAESEEIAAAESVSERENPSETAGKKQLPVASTEAASESEAPHYNSIMKPYDEIKHGKRLVILQNTLNFSREGIISKEEAAVAGTISYNGIDYNSYELTNATQHLSEAPAGDVTIYMTDGSSSVVAAEELDAMYVLVDDFKSGNAPILYNKETGASLENFDYAVMENGEGIFSVIPEQEINVNELLTSYGWDTSATYHLVATDAFYIPITPEDYDDGEIRGALSGAVNASFPEMTIAMGKISDVIFVEGIVE